MARSCSIRRSIVSALGDHDGSRNQGDGGSLVVGLAAEAFFAEEVAVSQDSEYGAAPAIGNRREFHQAFLDVEHLAASTALGEDDLVGTISDDLLGGQKVHKGMGAAHTLRVSKFHGDCPKMDCVPRQLQVQRPFAARSPIGEKVV